VKFLNKVIIILSIVLTFIFIYGYSFANSDKSFSDNTATVKVASKLQENHTSNGHKSQMDAQKGHENQTHGNNNNIINGMTEYVLSLYTGFTIFLIIYLTLLCSINSRSSAKKIKEVISELKKTK